MIKRSRNLAITVITEKKYETDTVYFSNGSFDKELKYRRMSMIIL